MINPRAIGYLKGYKCDIDELKALIETQEDFELGQISGIIDGIINQKSEKEQEVRDTKEARKQEHINTGYRALFEYLELEDTPENRKIIGNSWISEGVNVGTEIVDFFREKEIISLDHENEWNYGFQFLAWLLEKHDSHISYDAIMFLAARTGIKPTEQEIDYEALSRETEERQRRSTLAIRKFLNWWN